MAESIIHCNGVRIRLNGSGNFDMRLSSLDDVKTKNLRPFDMDVVTAIEPTRNTNFMSQRMALRVSVDEIDEWFVVNRIILYLLPVYDSYPSSKSG